MLKQIRLAMAKDKDNLLFSNIVEIDETYIGGKPRKENKHGKDDNYKRNKRGQGTSKEMIIGVKERNTNKIYAEHFIGRISGNKVLKLLCKLCENKTTVMTDQATSYNILNDIEKNSKGFVRCSVNHNKVFKVKDYHTNGIESIWAVMKRGYTGIYHYISIDYLQNYIDEFCFRLNNRNVNEAFFKLLNLAVV